MSLPRDGDHLGVSIPSACSLVVREVRQLTPEEREKVQRATEYNVFSFPASMLICDYLSDSGTTAMTDVQWSSLFRGDESYGRNHGYFALLDSVRYVFEGRGPPNRLVDSIIVNAELSPEEWNHPFEGGFTNGGVCQLARPNCFIVPQGRCAEHLLFSTISEFLPDDDEIYAIPSNGFFDTTEAQAHVNEITPINLFSPHLHDPFDVEDLYKKNPFKGDIDIERLLEVMETYGREKIPLILLTITNNTAAGQPVSMKNIRETSEIAKKYNVPLFFDAARFAENAWFIKEFEEGYENKSVLEIVREMFSYADGFTMSMKKDGLCNIGGLLCFRDRGLFHRNFSTEERDVGVAVKEKQILTFGNDSYGGMSGRDIMAAAKGLTLVVGEQYLKRRVYQTRSLAYQMSRKGIPAILPPGGHAVYVDMDKFFEGSNRSLGSFSGVGLTLELIKLYGIRACELGPFAFEWDKKTEEERKGILNLVRFAIPRNMYSEGHISYTVAAVSELHSHKDSIPNVEIVRGEDLHLRHFQSGLRPVYIDKQK